ncbi:MAG TPA: hypothetical protein VMY42_26505 [Thermoguttaceae bacterium]|nr:hypothetical protein [Thermoguttaceae bacterium]
MSDHMKKVQPGDSLAFPARTFNTFIDTARAFRAHQHDRRRTAQPAFNQAGIILVRNDSGADCDRFGVLGIDGPIIEPADNADEFKRQVALSGVAPTEPGRFVIPIEPIADGKIGRAVACGVTVAQVYVTQETHAFADIEASETDYLVSGQHGGAEILWKESGTGIVSAVVRVGIPTLFRRFELQSTLALGGTATAYMLDWTAGGYAINSSVVFTVYDSRGHFRGWPRIDSPERLGAWGLAMFCQDRGVWEIVAMQQLAEAITFTTTESMGYTLPGQVAVTVNDYYRGANPEAVYGTISVYDPQGLFPRALTGAKGKATLDPRGVLEQYHIVECWQMAEMLLCTSSGAVSSSYIPINADATKIMQPITGQSPGAGPDASNPAVTGVYDTFDDNPPTGTLFLAAWNENNNRWECIRSGKQTVIEHGVVYMDYPSYAATARREIEITLCDKAGENQTGDHFTAYTGIHPNFNTVLPEGTVVDFVRNAAGEPIIVSHHHEKSPLVGPVLHAIVQSGWTNVGATYRATVSVKACNAYGADVTGDAFDVYTSICAGLYTYLFEGSVVDYSFNAVGIPIIESHHLGPPFGAIEFWEGVYGDLATDRPGWEWYEGFASRVPMGIDRGGSPAADEDTIGDTGGFRKHGTTENNHTAHAAHTHGNANDPVEIDTDNQPGSKAWNASGSGDPITTEVAAMTHSDTDNRMLYRVTGFIKRTS